MFWNILTLMVILMSSYTDASKPNVNMEDYPVPDNYRNNYIPDRLNAIQLTPAERETINLMAQRIASHMRAEITSEIDRLGSDIYSAIKIDQEKADGLDKDKSVKQYERRTKHMHEKPHKRIKRTRMSYKM